MATGVLHCSQGVAAAAGAAGLIGCWSAALQLAVLAASSRVSNTLGHCSLGSLAMPQQKLLQLQLEDATACELKKKCCKLIWNARNAWKFISELWRISWASSCLSPAAAAFFGQFLYGFIWLPQTAASWRRFNSPNLTFSSSSCLLASLSSWLSVFLAKTSFWNWFSGSLLKRLSLFFYFFLFLFLLLFCS